MDRKTYDKLLFLDKILNNVLVNLPKEGEQRNYLAQALYETQYKFMVVMNRKGHKKKRLSMMMISKEGPMMRFDIIGKPHQQMPTPHLHIFTNENNNVSFFQLKDGQ